MPKTAKKTNKGGAKAEASNAAEIIKADETVVAPEKKKAELTSDILVPCMSNVSVGKLVYASKRQNGYIVEWSRYSEVQYIELGELVAMKSSALGFFSDNLILIPDDFEYKDDVLKYLRVERYYENAADPVSMKRLMNAPIDTMKKRIMDMGEISKKSVCNYVRIAIESGEIDSMKRIKALEEVLECDLM